MKRNSGLLIGYWMAVTGAALALVIAVGGLVPGAAFAASSVLAVTSANQPEGVSVGLGTTHAVDGFTLERTSGTDPVEVHEVAIQDMGTNPGSTVVGVKIYRDNGDAIFGPEDESLNTTPATFIGPSTSVHFDTPEPVSTLKQYWVVYTFGTLEPNSGDTATSIVGLIAQIGAVIPVTNNAVVGHTFTVDTHGPSVAILAPTNNGVLGGGSSTIMGTTFDAQGVVSAEISILSSGGKYWDGAAWVGPETWIPATLSATGTINPSWSYEWAFAPAFQSGTPSYEILARATNSLGAYNIEYAPAPVTNVTVDNIFNIYASAGAHGAISPSGNVSVNWGTDRTFSFTPDPHYHVASLAIGIGSAEPTAATSYTFTNVSADSAISVNFEPDTFTISALTSANGTITPTTQSVDYGSASATLTITPNAGYHFASASDKNGTITTVAGSVAGTREYKFTNVTQSNTISAVFEPDTFTISALTSANGTITPTTQSVGYGSASATLTITPNAGYHFASASDKNGTITTVAGSVAGTREYKFTNVTQNNTISAVFTLTPPIVYTLSYFAGPGGSIVGSATQSVDSGTSGTQVIATPAANHHFEKWSDNDSTDPVRTDSNVTASLTATATFAVDTFKIGVVPSAGGSVTPSTTQTVDFGSDSPTFTATPSTGHHFVSATDNGQPLLTVPGTVPGTRQFKLTGVTTDHTIAVTFDIDTFTLTYTAGAHGSIVGSATQVVDYDASGSSVTASPSAGYRFVKWSDESTANPRTDTGVRRDVDVSATFAQESDLFPVWRFRQVGVVGSYLWTASASEKASIEANLGSTWVLEGVAYEVNGANPGNDSPLMRFLNAGFWTYLYSASPGEIASIVAHPEWNWSLEGRAWDVSQVDSDTTMKPVWRFRCLKNTTYLWTSSPEEKATIESTLKADYVLEGIAYYVGQ